MPAKRRSLVSVAAVIAASIGAYTPAEEPHLQTTDAAPAALPPGQEMLKLPVRVVDAVGASVIGAKVTPYALRSSPNPVLYWQEHDKWAGVGPKDAFTDGNGLAVVLYPRFRDLQKKTLTISVSLLVDHPEFALGGYAVGNVLMETDMPYEIALTPGAPVEVRPLIDGEPADLDDLYALWSDGRSRQAGCAPERIRGDRLLVPAMRAGRNSLLLVKLDGDRATHFSNIVEFELQTGEKKLMDVPLRPALQIEGVVSDNVPRPVRNGRVQIRTLPPERIDRVQWFTWVPIRPDGTFTIDGWPPGEPLQVIALCDGFSAAPGNPAAVQPDARLTDNDAFCLPQVFEPAPGEQIEVAMTPLIRCRATAVDRKEMPITGVNVLSRPMVAWRHSGLYLYCRPLIRGERVLRTREYPPAVDNVFPVPFQGETDVDGHVTLELPAGLQALSISINGYELPAFRGSREIEIEVGQGRITDVTLRLQPRDPERLESWDLADIVFRCSADEFRAILAMPRVRNRLNAFIRQFSEPKNQRDPKLLSEAYLVVADAYVDAGNESEAAKWFAKAAEQAAKASEATAAEPASDN